MRMEDVFDMWGFRYVDLGKVSWNVIGVRDVKWFVMGGGNYSNGVENMCVGFVVKWKGFLYEEIIFKEILFCGWRVWL